MYQLINLIYQILYMCLIARVVLSWIDHNPNNEIIKWVYKISDLIIRPIQRILPPMNIGIDISPIIAIIILGFIKGLIL
jgi:YggT family protein